MKVIFRRWRRNAGIVAIFPTEAGDMTGASCKAFDGVTHQIISRDYFALTQGTRPVTEMSEYQSLLAELQTMGVQDIQIVKHATVLDIVNRQLDAPLGIKH